MANKVSTFFKETKNEMGKVNWPSRGQIIKSTLLVIAISLGTAVYLGFLDFILQRILEQVFKQ